MSDVAVRFTPHTYPCDVTFARMIRAKVRYFTGINTETNPASVATVQVGPNPVRAGRVTLRYSLPVAGPMHVRIYGRARQLSWQLALPAAARGTSALDLSKLAGGIYLLRVEARGVRLSQQLVVMP